MKKLLFYIDFIDEYERMNLLLYFIALFVVWLIYPFYSAFKDAPIFFPLIVSAGVVLGFYLSTRKMFAAIRRKEYLKYVALKTEDSFESYSPKCIENFFKFINDSPLDKVIGECRFVNRSPEDFDPEDKSFFDKNEIKIIFSSGDRVIGLLAPKQNNVDHCDFDIDDNLMDYNLSFSYVDQKNKLRIIIRFSNAWPYLCEFGEFIAYRY